MSSTTPIESLASLRIGTVEYVSPDEFKILLDTDTPDNIALNTGLPRPFPRINGYLLIPIDQGFVVGQITWITIERSNFPVRKGFKDFGLIDLPFPLRKLCLNPVGTLSNNKEFKFTRGVECFPSVGDIVLLPTDEQLRKGANILETNLEKRSLGRILSVGYPMGYYTNSLDKAIFSTVNFDISQKGNFYVTYEADTLIYQYDKDYNEQMCFGFSGKNMDLDYVTINTLSESRKNWRNERQTKGYYNWLEYVDETGLLFRSYQKGETQSTDGLQIYKDGVLFGDVSVPKGLRVMGYVAPYYYSYVIADEEHEVMYMYLFKL